MIRPIERESASTWDSRLKGATSLSSGSLEDGCHALTTADAHRDDSAPGPERLQRVEQLHIQYRTGGADRVSEGDGAAGHVRRPGQAPRRG